MIPLRVMVGETAEVLIVILVIVLIVVLIRNARRALENHAPQRENDNPASEAELIREIMTQVEKMDRRISNLETILEDQESRKSGETLKTEPPQG